MIQFKLIEGLYLLPSPAGAFQAVSSTVNDRPRQFLQRLLRQIKTPELSVEQLIQLTGLDEESKALELLHHCQRLGWVQGVDSPRDAPQGALEDILPELLADITEHGKVLLADEQGFYLACSGFAHETAEELSALSADLALLHQRHAGLLLNNMGISSHAWALVDVFGNSQIGFWPLFIGANRFVVAIAGIPHFNREAFVLLVWALSTRYGQKPRTHSKTTT